MKVSIELKNGDSCECIALHLRSIITQMKKIIGKPLLYTTECINAEVKSNAAIGELNHNVNFKDDSTKTSLIQRALVVRKTV